MFVQQLERFLHSRTHSHAKQLSNTARETSRAPSPLPSLLHHQATPWRGSGHPPPSDPPSTRHRASDLAAGSSSPSPTLLELGAPPPGFWIALRGRPVYRGHAATRCSELWRAVCCAGCKGRAVCVVGVASHHIFNEREPASPLKNSFSGEKSEVRNEKQKFGTKSRKKKND